MNLKYCFGEEIHKTYNLPQNFSSLLQDIHSSFDELPSSYVLQYTDADGDRITISTDHDYQTLYQHEILRCSSIKINIFPQSEIKGKRSLSSGSFEVIDDDHSKTEESFEDPLKKNQTKQDEEAKVVVSLQIPPFGHKTAQYSEKFSTSFQSEGKQLDLAEPTKTESAKSSESFDLDLSFPQEEKASDNEENYDRPLPPQMLNRGFQTEEEGLNLSQPSPKIKRERNQELFGKNVGVLRNQANELLDSSLEIDFKDSREGMNNLFKRKIQPVIGKDFSKHTNNPNSSKVQGKRKGSIDGSHENWSLKNEPQERPVTKNFETRKRNLFHFRKSPDDWQNENQENRDHGNLTQERTENNEEFEKLQDFLGQRIQKRAFFRGEKEKYSKLRFSQRTDSMSMDKTVGQIEAEENFDSGEDEDLSQVDQFRSYLPKKTFEENDLNDKYEVKEGNQISEPQNAEADIWYDPQDIQTYFQNNLQASPQQIEIEKKLEINLISSNLQSDFCKPICCLEEQQKKPHPQPSQLERRLIGPESRSASLTLSETNEILSFVGPDHHPSEPEYFGTNSNQQINQALNRWIVSKKRTDEHIDEEWPFSEEPNATFFEKPQAPFDCGDLFDLLKIESKVSDCQTFLQDPPAAIMEDQKSRNLNSSPVASKSNLPNDEFRFRLEGSEDEGESGKFKDSLDLLGHQHTENHGERFQFECREISSTPLWIKSNQREWCLIYKTVCLKNTGLSKWRRCYLEPIGQITGTMTEVSFVVPGDVVFLTLEIHGFFRPGSYTSHWRVVHQNESDLIDEMGSFTLNFEILEN